MPELSGSYSDHYVGSPLPDLETPWKYLSARAVVPGSDFQATAGTHLGDDGSFGVEGY